MTDLFLGATADGTPQCLPLSRANRHGLIAGATGTGKTVTLQIMAEGFSRAGVPVLLPDVKGDLAGLAMAGASSGKAATAVDERARRIGLGDHPRAGCPVVFWDVWGEAGHPLRATVSEMGPLLLARLMGLNDTQSGVLEVAFRAADEAGLLLLDLDDLRALMRWTAENASDLSNRYGQVSKASVGAIQRALLQLDGQGAAAFFGEPALDVADLMRVGADGRGVVNILAADRLMRSPKLYATVLLWLLSDLFEALPEVGDPDTPVLALFLDEAHLLFGDDTPDALMDKMEQVVRLIRSKGVGVYLVTQNPLDVPERIAGQLGHRVQHALRAFTPREQRAVRAAAETFRANPDLDVATVITELGVGEALVSTLGADGVPSVVQRTLIRPPESRMGPITAGERRDARARSPIGTTYDTAVNRVSAAEVLAAKADDAEATARQLEEEGEDQVRAQSRRTTSFWERAGRRAAGAAASSLGNRVGRQLSGRPSRASPTRAAAGSVASSIGTELGMMSVPGLGRFARGLLGGLLR